jgi:heterodisulfide reductase subunit B
MEGFSKSLLKLYVVDAFFSQYPVKDKVALMFASYELNCLKIVGAQTLITSNPFCHIIFRIKADIKKMGDIVSFIPILHNPQLLGLTISVTPKDQTIDVSRIDTLKIIKRVI